MADTTTVSTMTIDQAWDQIAEWFEAGHSITLQRGEGSLALYVGTRGAAYPHKVESTDRPDLLVIDCVQRMTRLLAFQSK